MSGEAPIMGSCMGMQCVFLGVERNVVHLTIKALIVLGILLVYIDRACVDHMCFPVAFEPWLASPASPSSKTQLCSLFHT